MVDGKISIMREGDRFFLFTQWRVSCRKPCHYLPSLFCNCFSFFQILLAHLSARKIRNGSEFQQRGQKNSANSLQMCLWAVWGSSVLPSLERKRTLHCTGESSMNYEWKTSVTQYSWFWLSVWFSEKRKQATQEYIIFPLLVCRITGVFVSHPESTNTSTYCCFLKSAVTAVLCWKLPCSWINETATGHLWRQNRKQTRFTADVAWIQFGKVLFMSWKNSALFIF